MAIKELVTRFGFEVDDKGLKELQEGIDAVKGGLLHLGELLVGEAVGLYELVQKSSEAGVQLKIMTQETGLAAQELQELQFRAKLADVSTDELNMSMNFLARNLEQARQGSEEARRHFRLLGVSVAEIRNGTATADVVIKRMAKTFEKMPDGPRKTGLAMEIFGRSGARMVPFLNSLNTALDPVNQKIMEMSMITDDQIETSEEFHVNLETLKTALLGVVRVVGFGLMPVANEIITTMKKWVVTNKDLIVTDLTEFVKGLAAALKITLRVTDALITAFAGFAHAVGGVKILVELLLGSMAVLSGLSILFGIGKVVQAVYSLASAFAVADLAAAAIPIAIGAAIAAIFLIIQDIFTFFHGGDSVTGRLLKVLPEIGNMFKSILGPVFEPFMSLIKMVTGGFSSWKDLFKELGVLIINVILMPLRTLIGTIGMISSAIGRLTHSDKLKGFGDGAIDVAGALKLNDPASAVGISPQTAVGSSGGASKQVNNDLQVTQQFNFPPGTDPAVVGDKISSSVSDGLDDVLRLTKRSTSNGGAF